MKAYSCERYRCHVTLIKAAVASAFRTPKCTELTKTLTAAASVRDKTACSAANRRPLVAEGGGALRASGSILMLKGIRAAENRAGCGGSSIGWKGWLLLTGPTSKSPNLTQRNTRTSADLHMCTQNNTKVYMCTRSDARVHMCIRRAKPVHMCKS